MPLSNIQKGAVGQFTFLATALATGGGQVEVYTPVADSEGRDGEVRRHLKRAPAIGVQIKVVFSLSRSGSGGPPKLRTSFRVAAKRIQNDPRLCYFFGFHDPKELRFQDPVFIVPAGVFHRIGRMGKGIASGRAVAA